ncbi:MAG: MmgE/PrpD family protein, partial [Alphaproteobacteria bacterium]|nr:MmgE/PrpD family protein [Alphaproteobacteria bacterium]
APFDELGERWRVAELSHKPFPSGRATHGGIDGLQRLIDEDGVTAERFVACRFCVPPLTARLVARPAVQGMSAGYARLSLPYVGAVCLRRGTVGLGDFTAATLADPETLRLSRRLTVVEDGNPDPNALLPQRVELDLAEGRTVAVTVDAVLGSPVRPLSPEAMRAKFNECWHSVSGLPPEQATVLWDAVDVLETVDDVRSFARLTASRQP